MAIYTDLFVRSNFSDDGTIPRAGAQSASPDIIPWGMTPQAAPQTFFAGNYSSDPGVPLTVGAQNFLYVRAKNLGGAASTGTVKLYWALSSLLLYPGQWINNAMTTSGGAATSAMTNVAANAIGVTTDAFTWNPTDPPSGQHYCLVAQVATPANPNPIPSTGAITDFAAWVAGAGGIGWRNVSVVDAGSPTFTTLYNYPQGTVGSSIQFQLTATGCPVGSQIAFTSGTPVPGGPPVAIPKTTIPDTGGQPFVIGTSATIPANWVTNFAISYWSNGLSPLPGFKIQLLGLLITSSGVAVKLNHLGHPLEHFGVKPHHVHHRHGGEQETYADFFKAETKATGGPVRAIVVGGGTAVHNPNGGL